MNFLKYYNVHKHFLNYYFVYLIHLFLEKIFQLENDFLFFFIPQFAVIDIFEGHLSIYNDFRKFIFAGGNQVNAVKVFDSSGKGMAVINQLSHAPVALDSSNDVSKTE